MKNYKYISSLKNKLIRIGWLSVLATIINCAITEMAIAEESNNESPTVFSSSVIDDWSGTYLVGIIGFSNGEHTDNSFNLNPNLIGFSKLSLNNRYSDDLNVLGGVALGWQKQLDNFIVGFESDWIHTGLEFVQNNPDFLLSSDNGTAFGFSGNAIDRAGANFQATSKLNWIGTVRPRIGYVVIPELAIYGTVGFAYGEVSTSLNEAKIFTLGSGGKANSLAVGWSIGAGAEYKLTSNLFIRAEYLFVNLEANNVSLPFAGGSASHDFEFNVHLAKFGIAYKF